MKKKCRGKKILGKESHAVFVSNVEEAVQGHLPEGGDGESHAHDVDDEH